ncbi:hypothetical protein FS749_004900 [Ceratobasidium sp. UAMH 11750]|nr:hypothetical protein FS749_004900 [Ceratobasidium sp. UAMH 11750]
MGLAETGQQDSHGGVHIGVFVVDKEDHEFLQSWRVFKQAFLLHFGDLVKKEKAIQELGSLTQVKSVQAYTTHFRNLAQEVDWNREALVDKFKEGLKPEV